jgi:hypothetical protein
MINTPFFYRYNEVSTFNQWSAPTWDVFNNQHLINGAPQHGMFLTNGG